MAKQKWIRKDKDGRYRFRRQWTFKGKILKVTGCAPKTCNTALACEKAMTAAMTQAEEDASKAPVVSTEAAKVLTLQEFVTAHFIPHVRIKNKPSEVTAKESILKTHLLPVLGHLPIDQVSASHVDSLTTALLGAAPPAHWVSVNNHQWRPLSAKRINNVLTVLRYLFVYAQELEVLDKAPKCKKLKQKASEFEFFSREQFNHLVESSKVEPDWHAAILVAGECGLRLGELLALRWQDVNFKTSSLTVALSNWRGQVGTPKSGKERVVPLLPRVIAALKAIQHLRSKQVFAPWTGEPFYTTTNMAAAIKRQLKRAGLIGKHYVGTKASNAQPAFGEQATQSVGWHALRHTFCSNLAAAGVPPISIKDLAGHSTIAVSDRYMHTTPKALVDAMALLEQA